VLVPGSRRLGWGAFGGTDARIDAPEDGCRGERGSFRWRPLQIDASDAGDRHVGSVKDYQRCAIANRGVEGGAAVGLRVGEGVSAMRLRYSTHPRLVGVWEDPWRGHRRRVQADVFVCVFFKDGECFNPLAPRH
jgi:hypothetical protein